MSRYLLAVLSVVVALVVRLAMAPLLNDRATFLSFFFAIAVTAAVAGLGLVATALSVLTAAFFLLQPTYSLSIESPADRLQLAMFCIMAVGVCWLSGSLRKTRRRIEGDRVRLSVERKRFRLAAEAVNGIIYEYDFTTGHVERTRGLYEVTGYRPEEVPPTAAWWHEQVHPDDRESARRRFEEAAASSNSVVTEYRLRHKDGRWLHVEDRAVILKDGGGQPVKLVGCTVDVTGRKQAEEALRGRTQELETLLDALPAFVWISRDAECRVIVGNRAANELTGIEPGANISQSAVASGEAPYLRQLKEDGTEYRVDELPLQRAIATREPVRDVVVDFDFPDGRRVQALGTTVPLFDEEGRPRGGVAAFADITQRKQAEKTLADRTALLTGVLEGTSDVIFAKDLNGRILLVNAAFAAAAKSTPEQLVGKTDEDWFPPDVAAAVRQQDRAVIAGGSPMQFEDTVPVAGEARVFNTQKAPLRDGSSRIVGILGIGRDVTERKRTEEALREKVHFLQRVTTITPSVVYIMDLTDLRITWVNAQVATVMGYSVEEVLEMGPAFMPHAMHPDDLVRMPAHFEQLARSRDGELVEIEYRLRRPDGTWRWFGGRQTPFCRDAKGNVCEIIGTSSDITERKQAEEAMRASEEFNRSLMDGSADCVKVLDLDGRLLDMNAPGRCLMEIDDFGPMCGQEWTALWPAEARQDIERAMAAARGGDSCSFPAFCPTAKGTPRWWDVMVSPVRNASDGAVVRLLSVSRDITARKAADEAVTRLAAIVESSHDALFSEDLDGIVTSWNRGAEQIFGYRADEIIGTSIMRLIPEARREAEHEMQRNIVAGERGGTFETIRRAKDGREFHASITLSPLKDAAGNIIGTSRVVRDITERKAAEAALLANEERMRLATAATEVGIWEWNVRTNRILWDAEMFRIYGVAPTSDGFVTYETWSGAVLPEDLAENEAVLQDTVRRCGRSTRTLRIRRSHDKEVRCIEAVETVRTDAQGETEWVVGTNLDVTERVLATNALRDADRRKGEFLATLAHELRNPLAPIRNGLQIMKLPQVDAGTVEKSRSMMERQVEQMTRLIDDLMDVSRINQGKIQLQTTRMPLADAVRNAVDTSRPLIDVQGHELVVDMPPQPIYVDGDLTRLSQVFVNLLNNSAKYTNPGGRIQLSVERRGDDVVVSVSDNGVGIPADKLAHVFEMFAQIDGSLEKSQGGLGIGLNIVKRLVEMHGGSITAESGGPGLGSTFTVRLPEVLNVTIDNPGEHKGVAQAKPKRRRILVVDDNVDGAKMLAMMLGIMGNEIQKARDGLEAVAVAEAFKPDVILMDIGMPKMNGYDACHRIRAEPWGRDIVIVAQTGWGQEDDKRKSQEAGFNFHMVKPIDPAALEKLLLELNTKAE